MLFIGYMVTVVVYATDPILNILYIRLGRHVHSKIGDYFPQTGRPELPKAHFPKENLQIRKIHFAVFLIGSTCQKYRRIYIKNNVKKRSAKLFVIFIFKIK